MEEVKKCTCDNSDCVTEGIEKCSSCGDACDVENTNSTNNCEKCKNSPCTCSKESESPVEAPKTEVPLA